MAEYEKQYDRMLRWLEKIESMVKGDSQRVDKEEFHDHFIIYFQLCYHLKDHLENDPQVSISESDVESFIDTNDHMSLCADICNATKHLTLDNSGRSGEKPELHEGKGVTIRVGEGDSLVTKKVKTDSGELDSYELAKECKEAWDTFLQSNRLFTS
ncbi:hypothetical protein [Natronorubrum sp. FCH18a]|uniref:hypothetical protein n=1 Tax=Natronorubrum sp. FCH18a TaxID=3447018 RepID=UPI003F50F7CF